MTSQEQHIPTIVSSIRQGGVGFHAAAICGLAAYLVLLRRSYFATMFHAAGFEGGFLEPYYALFLIASLLLAITVYFTAGRIEPRVDYGASAVRLLPYLSVVGATLVFASTATNDIESVVLVVGVLIFAFGTTSLALFLTLSIVSRITSKRIIGILVISAYFLSTLLSLGSSLLPSALNPVFVVGCPLISSLAWRYCKPDAREEVLFEIFSVEKFKLSNAVFLAIAYLVCSVMLGCNFTASLSSATTPVYFGTHGFILVACFVLLAIMMFAVENSFSAFVLEIVGVLAFIALFFFSALLEPEWVSLSANIVASARLCFELLLWIVVLCSAVSKNASAFIAAGCFLALRIASDVLVNLLVPWAISLSGGMATDVIQKIALALFFVLSLTFIVIKIIAFFSKDRSDKSSENGEIQGFSDNCDQLATRYGLSKRETEILQYIARGHSSRWIAGTLCISMSTVQSHSKSIYRKLGIHNKQQLLELVNPVD